MLPEVQEWKSQRLSIQNKIDQLWVASWNLVSPHGVWERKDKSTMRQDKEHCETRQRALWDNAETALVYLGKAGSLLMVSSEAVLAEAQK